MRQGRFDPPDPHQPARLAAAAWLAARDAAGQAADVWHRLGRRRLTPHESPRQVFLEDLDGTVAEVQVAGTPGTYGSSDQLMRDLRVEYRIGSDMDRGRRHARMPR